MITKLQIADCVLKNSFSTISSNYNTNELRCNQMKSNEIIN